MARAKIKVSKEENIDQRLMSGIKFNMIRCLAGEFWMGSEDGVGYAYEKPRHQVKMNKAFWIGETQVTQALWQAVMGWNPSMFKGSGKLPVESMTWYDCLVFCNQLSELEGLSPCFNLTNIEKDGNHITKADVEWHRLANGYRLPTEAEWEYCAKSGTELIYSGSNLIDEVGWYDENSRHKTHQVKKKKHNAWGLYDMSGNVWEWCMDQWDPNAYKSRSNGIENPSNCIENPILWDHLPCVRVVRGGSLRLNAVLCRVAFRFRYDADIRNHFQGFRLLRCEA